MSDESPTSLGDWRLGVHPGAAGLRVRSLERVELPLGDALRLEMDDPEGGAAVVHVQYVISTDAGPWALWISCSPANLAANEAILAGILPISTRQPQDHPPTFHPPRAPFAGFDEG